MGETPNTEFDFIGVNHLAPVCRAMQDTLAPLSASRVPAFVAS